MKKYERVREIFNSCSKNQMRDVDIEEIEIDDIETDVQQFCVGLDTSIEQCAAGNGTISFYISISGLNQRISYTEL
jgi:hypothetical protein